MNRISFNLLPREELILRKQGSKIALINRISIGCLVFMIFLTSIALTLRILQRFELQEVNVSLTKAEAQVNNLKDKETQISVLKGYLKNIQSLQGVDAKRKSIFNLVIFLMPEDIQVTDLTVDKNGNAIISASSATLLPLERFLSDLANKEKNSDLITKVELEGLAIGRDGIYRFDLKIVPK